MHVGGQNKAVVGIGMIASFWSGDGFFFEGFLKVVVIVYMASVGPPISILHESRQLLFEA